MLLSLVWPGNKSTQTVQNAKKEPLYALEHDAIHCSTAARHFLQQVLQLIGGLLYFSDCGPEETWYEVVVDNILAVRLYGSERQTEMVAAYKGKRTFKFVGIEAYVV